MKIESLPTKEDELDRYVAMLKKNHENAENATLEYVRKFTNKHPEATVTDLINTMNAYLAGNSKDSAIAAAFTAAQRKIIAAGLDKSALAQDAFDILWQSGK